MKKKDNWSVKLVLLFVVAVVLLLGYSTAAQAAESLETNSLDPFTLTLSSTSSLSSDGPNDHASDRAKIMVPYRGPKRSPVKPPWP